MWLHFMTQFSHRLAIFWDKDRCWQITTCFTALEGAFLVLQWHPLLQILMFFSEINPYGTIAHNKSQHVHDLVICICFVITALKTQNWIKQLKILCCENLGRTYYTAPFFTKITRTYPLNHYFCNNTSPTSYAWDFKDGNKENKVPLKIEGHWQGQGK